VDCHYPEAWQEARLAATTAVFCLEYSFEQLAARPISRSTLCRLSLVPNAEIPGTSKHRFPFAPRRKAFEHPVRTMLEECFPSLQVDYRL
jgi:hypothetical protein